MTTLIGLLAFLGLSMSGANPEARTTQEDELSRLAGDWLFVEDRTEGRTAAETQPPMSVQFALRVEKDAIVMKRGQRPEERIALDGSVTEESHGASIHRSSGSWKDGRLIQTTELVRAEDEAVTMVIRMEFRASPEGLLVRVVNSSPPDKVLLDGIALYRHPTAIPLPTPAKAEIADLAWLAGAWVGTRRRSSIEERWSPPLGGAMLGLSRTVKGGKMIAFEYLRIVERDGGLVYVAQPGGNPPTEFVLTELSQKRAVFDNPRHDSPQRIVYELTDQGLAATTSFINSGPYYRFEFNRADD
ncbi:MAG: hypothetical protein H6807_15450 [Planctomycetes bacterium]|nr:hypothetical protein [Planctomycetota bacterium]